MDGLKLALVVASALVVTVLAIVFSPMSREQIIDTEYSLPSNNIETEHLTTSNDDTQKSTTNFDTSIKTEDSNPKSAKPLVAWVSPIKVMPGDTMRVYAEADAEKVTAEFQHEKGYDTVELSFINGVWQGNWLVHDTIEKEYITKVTAIIGGQSYIETVKWRDDITSTLIGWWKLDSVNGSNYTLDSSGFNNHGRALNFSCNPATCNTTAGKIKNSLRLDGTDDYINVSNESRFDFERTDPFSVSVWVRQDSASNGHIIGKGDSGDSLPGYRFFISSDGKVNFEIGNTASLANRISTSTDSTFTFTDWTHVAVTYSGSSNAAGVKIFVNGVSYPHTAVDDSLVDSTLNNFGLTIGTGGDGAFSYFKGNMDDLRIYSRTLSGYDIVELYNTGPMVHLKMEFVNSTNYTADASDNNNPGVVTNLTCNPGNCNITYGQLNNGLILDSQYKYVDIDASGSKFAIANGTFAAWVKFRGGGWGGGAPSSNGVNVIASMSRDNVGADNRWMVSNTSNTLRLDWDVADAGVQIDSGVAVSLNKWYHVAYTFSSTSGLKFYVDGVEKGSNSNTNGWDDIPGSDRNPLSIGRDFDGGVNGGRFFFNGTVDDVRVYNRTLSASEILELYSTCEAPDIANWNISARCNITDAISVPNNLHLETGGELNITSNVSFNVSNHGNLVAHLKLDSVDANNYTVDSFRNNSGRLINFPCSPATCNITAGKINNSLQFDGTNDYVNISDSAALRPVQLSVSFWMKSSSSNNQFPIEKRNDGGTTGWMFQDPIADGLFFQVFGANGERSAEDNSFAIDDGNWHYVVGTYDGTSRLYIDGDLRASSTSGGGDLNHNTDPITIGANGGGASFFSGNIDDVRIYNRSLHAHEISDLYRYDGTQRIYAYANSTIYVNKGGTIN